MKVETILRRLEASKTNKRSSVYNLVVSFCEDYKNGKYKVIHTCKGNGYRFGRYHGLTDKTTELTSLLNKLRVSYEKGNDAPRGGRLGTYVKIINMRRK